MAEQVFPCPLCHGVIQVTPARWHTCPHCQGRVLVPSALPSRPARACLCTVCGDWVRLQGDADDTDAVCTTCYDANFRGAFLQDQPTVAPLMHDRPAYRRALDSLNRQRWPLTHAIPL
jgi:hypothetical protein